MAPRGKKQPKGSAKLSPLLKQLLSGGSMDLILYSNRLATFKRKWAYDKDKTAVCTSEKLAKAGFYCTVSRACKDSAKCFFCRHEMLWDPHDDPITEHASHMPECPYLQLKKPEEEWTCSDVFKLLTSSFYNAQACGYLFEDNDNQILEEVGKVVHKLTAEAETVLESL